MDKESRIRELENALESIIKQALEVGEITETSVPYTYYLYRQEYRDLTGKDYLAERGGKIWLNL